MAQVPTLAPMTMATAPGSAIKPWLARARARPMVAADEVTSALNTAATSTAMTGVSVATRNRSMASSLLRSGATPSRISLRPRNISPRPSTAWPMSRGALRRAMKVTMKPRPIRSGA